MKKILIDTDCGMDDIIAILMLIKNNKSICGITTIRGLTQPFVGKRNLERVIESTGKNIEVISGNKYPLNKINRKNMFPKVDVVNSSKLLFLNNLISKKSLKVSKKVKVEDYIYNIVLKNKCDILCLGPLTNIAKTISKFGDKFTKNIKQIIIMGGAVFVPGNVSPKKVSEYNFFLDPEAANIVLGSGIKVILISMDATRFVPATIKIKQRINSLKPKTQIGKIIQKVIVSNQKDFRFFYDPLCSAIIINSKVIRKIIKISLKVLKNGKLEQLSINGNVDLPVSIDSKLFYKILLNAIK